MSREYLSVAEVAAILGVSEKTIRRSILAGQLPALKVRSRYAISPEALETAFAYRPAEATRCEPVSVSGKTNAVSRAAADRRRVIAQRRGQSGEHPQTG
jgi:excisionase family DNA binding protein